MWFILILPYTLHLFCLADSKVVIDLFRQPTPRMSIQNAPNIPEHGIWLDWLKKPYTDYRTNDTIPLLRFLDREYYAQIGVGSPGKPIKVTFDTAWSTSWIISNDCPIRKVGCWFHSKYDHGRSSTYIKDGRTYNANEGTYNLTGYYSRDVLKFGHTVIKQTFVEMTSIPYWYVFNKADGVIGLGFPLNKINPFFNNILTQTNITKPVFSIYLNRDKASDKGGSVILGAIDKKHIHVTKNVPDKITYVPVNVQTRLWQFSIDKIFLKVLNKTIPICTQDCFGLSDSTSNSIITSQEMLKEINEEIGARPFYFGRFEVNCDTINKLPFLTFVIGGTNFTLTGKDYTQKLSVGPFTVCISAFTAATTVSEEKRWILGGAFLAKYYSIYDVGNKQIGFVRAA
ncbi:hypothetical protein Trydic_g19690 [Trypoxylus dichotomus]